MAKDTEVRIVGGVPTSVTTADNLEGWTNESGAVAVNDAIYLSGASSVAKASAADGTQPCVGLVFEVTDATHCKVITHGLIENFSTGMTAGTRYYLSAAAAGALVTTPPSSTGNSVQYVGYATSGTDLLVEPDATPWVKAASTSNNALYWDPTNKRIEIAPAGSGPGGTPSTVRFVFTRDQLITYDSPSLACGQIEINGSTFPAGATVRLHVCGLLGKAPTSSAYGEVTLYNLTDSEAVTGTTMTFDPENVWANYVTSALTVGASAGNLKSTAKIYEMRVVLIDASLNDFCSFGSIDLEVAP